MKNILSSFVLAILISGCGNHTHVVSDVTQAESIILKKSASQGYISSINISGTGEITGNAEITLLLNGAPYKTEKLSGHIKFQWSGDWYSDQAEIEFTPTSVTGGNLTLKYKFYD